MIVLVVTCGRLCVFVFLFAVETKSTDDSGREIKRLSDDAAQGEENKVVCKPQRRANKRHTAQNFIFLVTECNGGNRHCQNGENFYKEVDEGRLFSKNGEYRNVRKNVNRGQSYRPRGVVGMNLVFVNEDQRANNGNKIEDRARKRAKQEEVSNKQNRTQELEC